MTQNLTNGTPAEFAEQTRALSDSILSLLGRDDDTIAKIMALDAAQFLWHRQAVRGDFGRLMCERLGLKLEHAQFLGLQVIGRLQLGFGGSEQKDVTIGVLAEEMAIDPSRASRIAAELVNKGFVMRDVSQKDARKSLLRLSQAGLATMHTIGRIKWQQMAKGLSSWTDAEIATFAALFERFATVRLGVMTVSDADVAENRATIAQALTVELASRR
jgi:DNA-binding MarR family transcriptional regulator